MTVQDLYDLASKMGDPGKIELKLRPDDDNLVEVEFEEENADVFVYLIAEGSIHL